MGTGPPAPQRIASAADLRDHVTRLGAQIGVAHPNGVTLVGVLKGSAMFLADLCRQISVPTRIETLAVAPYDGSAGRTRVVKDLDGSVSGEDVVLVSGIIDTGLTVDFLLRHLQAAGPASLSVCTLADKTARRIVPVQVTYRAIQAPDAFLLGYGLDYGGRYRNLSDLWAGDGAVLSTDPDAYVSMLYQPNLDGPARD